MSWRSAVVILTLVGAYFRTAQGQTVSTEILGLVTDSSGAVIPGARITAKRVETGDIRSAKTNETGSYLFPLLDPGEYEITVNAPGFKTEHRMGIVLQLQLKARLDFQLQVGQQVETVEVQATAPLLRTEDAALGEVIESKRVVDLPLNGRNFAQLATLMPGVVYGVSRMGLNGQGGFPIPGQMVAISANGQRDINQQITLDGVIATEPRVNTMTFTPSIDAIEEFKVQSAVYSAEYGMNSGAQVNVAIKSGTNGLHGTAFEFLRNDALDARGFFLPPNQPKNKLRRNQYGSVLSGPIKKDRTFWLFNWEGRRERRGTPSVTAVPTLAMRSGDFSEIAVPGNRWYPQDANPAVTRQIRAPGSSAPFPSNIIPPSLINRVTNNILTSKKLSPFADGGYLPFPNVDKHARAQNSPINLGGTNDTIINSDEFIGRIDHRFSDKDRIFGRYVIVDASLDSIPLARVSRLITNSRSQNIGSQWLHTFSPTVLNEFRYGYNRATDDIAGLFTNTDFTQRDLGLDFRVVGDNNRTLRKDEEGLPNIGIVGFSGIPSPSNAGWYDVHYVHHFADSVSISKGRHNFKFGGEYRYNFLDRGAANLPRGTISFTRDVQGIPDAFAAFLLGYPDNANTAEGVPPLFARQNRFGIYFLDDWKATPKLSLNLGIRYDAFTSVQDVKGKFRNLDFSRGVTINGIFAPMLWPDPNVQARLYDVPYTQVMPRIGIAYRINPTLVLRTGAGQFYNVQQINNFSILNLQPPFSGSNLFQTNRANPVATIDNPFAGSATTRPTALLMLGNIQPDGRSRYLNNDIWQWSIELEKSIGQNMVAAIGYVGSKGSNIDITISNWNNPDPGPGDIQSRRPLQYYVDSRDPKTLLPLGTVRRLDTSQNSWYHALQARFEKRYSRGLTFTGSYNFQKALAIGYGANEGAGFNTNVPQDPRNVRTSKGRSNIDQTHRFVFSHIYELPFFRDRKGPVSFLFGGWALNGIVQLTSGLPVAVTQVGDRQNTGAASAPRPDLVPGQNVRLDNRTIDRWFNTSAFQFSVFHYGNAGVGLFDAPAQKTWDFAVFKDFPIRERHKVQFRYETFNFLNTPQFSAPDRSLGSATFGRITSTITDNREMQFALKYVF